MKSIMEEASSIIKAIEKAWLQAGQPKEFSVKIFEESIKNFIGLTTRSAKIGIFFDAAPLTKPESPMHRSPKPQHTKAIKQASSPTPHKPVTYPNRQLEKQPAVAQQKELIQKSAEATVATKTISENQQELQEARQAQVVWSEAMMNDIQLWLKESLAFISIRPLNFSKEAQHFYLKVQFSEPIFEEKSRERQLFSSLATLLLQMLKHKYKRPLKGYKIILTSDLDHVTQP